LISLVVVGRAGFGVWVAISDCTVPVLAGISIKSGNRSSRRLRKNLEKPNILLLKPKRIIIDTVFSTEISTQDMGWGPISSIE
jgi:hypothetical protein